MGTALVLLSAVLIFTLFWLDSARARELATAIARSLCDRRGLQFLDDTVVLRRIGLRWGKNGLRLRRMFDFDFALGGAGRRSGYLILLGTDVELYGMDLPEQAPPESTKDVTPPAAETDPRGKVVPFRRPPR
jgi:hypothetical protein